VSKDTLPVSDFTTIQRDFHALVCGFEYLNAGRQRFTAQDAVFRFKNLRSRETYPFREEARNPNEKRKIFGYEN
jgi:hypothetical protein